MISQKQETTAAIKWKTFLLIPVGFFRCSSLGIQGHHYQNLQKLLSVIILHSTAPMCVELCAYVSLTRLGSNLCFTSFGFWGEWAVQLFYSVSDIYISQDESWTGIRQAGQGCIKSLNIAIQTPLSDQDMQVFAYQTNYTSAIKKTQLNIVLSVSTLRHYFLYQNVLASWTYS